MACCDCENCPRQVDNGGKCRRFEYNCPFVIIEKYNSSKLESIRNNVKKIKEVIEELEELDSDYYMEDEISSIKFQLYLFEGKVSEDTEKEYNEIRDE